MCRGAAGRGGTAAGRGESGLSEGGAARPEQPPRAAGWERERLSREKAEAARGGGREGAPFPVPAPSRPAALSRSPLRGAGGHGCFPVSAVPFRSLGQSSVLYSWDNPGTHIHTHAQSREWGGLGRPLGAARRDRCRSEWPGLWGEASHGDWRAEWLLGNPSYFIPFDQHPPANPGCAWPHPGLVLAAVCTTEPLMLCATQTTRMWI